MNSAILLVLQLGDSGPVLSVSVQSRYADRT